MPEIAEREASPSSPGGRLSCLKSTSLLTVRCDTEPSGMVALPTALTRYRVAVGSTSTRGFAVTTAEPPVYE